MSIWFRPECVIPRHCIESLTPAISESGFLAVLSDIQHQVRFTLPRGPARARTPLMLGVWAVSCGVGELFQASVF